MTDTCSNNEVPQRLAHPLPRQFAGLLISDPACRQLFEDIVINLKLAPYILQESDLSVDQLIQCDMVIADEKLARATGKLLRQNLAVLGEVKLAVIALISSPYTPPLDHRDSEDFNAVLMSSEQPALLSAQIEIALCVHYALARRYKSALEELNLDRKIFNSVTTGITVAKAQLPDMPLMYVNPAFESMTGYTLDEVIGENCRFLQDKDRDQPGLDIIREGIQQSASPLPS